MSKRSWDYIDPVGYDDMARLKQIHAAAMAYSGLEHAVPSQVVISAHTAKYRGEDANTYFPLTLDLLKMNVGYLNNSEGIWNIDRAPDTGTNHIRANLYDVTHLDLPEVMLIERAKYGAITMADYDPYTPFYPAFKNTNPEVALAPMYLSFVAAAIVHIAYDDWKRQIGSSQTDEQYVSKTTSFISGEIAKQFDGRYSYVIDSTVTPADKKRKYSWSTEVTVGIPNTKWVNKLRVISDNF